MFRSISEKFGRSWTITKSAFQVMKHDKEILAFPILSALFSTVMFLIFLLPIGLSLMGINSVTGSETVGTYFAVFIFYFIAVFSATFFNVGVVHIAKTRLEGGNATFMDGIRMSFSRLGKIIWWSLLSATIGLLLNILESRSREEGGVIGIIGRILASLIGFAWAIVSLFVVPAMVIKNQGPIQALKSSAITVKKTWGESLIKYYGFGFAKGIIVIIGFFMIAVPGILLILQGMIIAGGVLLGIFVLLLVLITIIFSAMSTIYDTALFMYADTGTVSTFFSAEELKSAFVPKRR